MSTTEQRWNQFWAGHTFDGLVTKKNPETWTELVWKISLERWHEIFEQLAPGKHMLEYGCGSAKVSQYMALRGYQCTLLDLSETALNLARANFAALSLQGQFIRGDINQLGLADNEFDVVYSGGVVEFVSDIQSVIAETVRVLKPSGLFAMNIVPNKFSCQTLANVERTLVHSIKCLWRRQFREAFTSINHLPPGVSKATLKDYLRFCEIAGLTSVTGHCISPFPALSLGRRGGQCYVWLLKRFLPQWQRFNQTQRRWAEIWGIAYAIYGVKPSF